MGMEMNVMGGQQPRVDETLCTLCGLCVEACPCHAVELGEAGPIFSCPEVCPLADRQADRLGNCCLCEEVCPTGAITCTFEIVVEADQDS